MCSVQCVVGSVQCEVYSVQYNVIIEHCSVCSVQCAVQLGVHYSVAAVGTKQFACSR